MNVIIQKLDGLWHLIVGSCQIGTPFLQTQDRAAWGTALSMSLRGALATIASVVTPQGEGGSNSFSRSKERTDCFAALAMTLIGKSACHPCRRTYAV
jgi:hypothetical protein